MSGPSEVWIDERVATTLPAAKDEELAERGVHQIQFINIAKVRELVRKAGGPDEFIVQLTRRENDRELDRLVVLTNFGRLYIETVGGWKELGLPEFES